jgi:hypothetical protein
MVSQYAEYGLNKKMPMFGIASFTSEELLASMPPQAVGIQSVYRVGPPHGGEYTVGLAGIHRREIGRVVGRGAGMMGDRADVIFADPSKISPFIAAKC